MYESSYDMSTHYSLQRLNNILIYVVLRYCPFLLFLHPLRIKLKLNPDSDRTVPLWPMLFLSREGYRSPVAVRAMRFSRVDWST